MLLSTILVTILPLFCNGYEYFGLSTISNIINGIKDFVDINQNDIQADSISNEANLDITQLVNKQGYNIEEHTVTTEDGYVLNLHRIPSRNLSKNNTAIFLMHGILDCSNSWILQGPENALAYILADAGFDVWMGNARGNKYSSMHDTLNKNDSAFWKFTWEEIGVYDLPAMIDHILNVTGKEDLYYVGHSQGSTVFFVMLALKPEYNAKVKMMFALAPISWISHATSPIFKLFAPAYGMLGYLTTNINAYSSSTEMFNNFPKLFCQILSIGCSNMLQWIIGNDYNLISPSLLPAFYGRVLSGSSTLQLIHYGQLYQSGRFCRFDLGPDGNLLKYASNVPPDYEINNVNVPVVLFYSENDWLSGVADVAQLFNKLPNVYDSYNLGGFNHLDYIYAYLAKNLVYLNIINIIDEFELNEYEEQRLE